MKAYIATTGFLFVALALAHVLRIFQERYLARDPWFVLTTVIALGLATWAFRFYRNAYASRHPVP